MHTKTLMTILLAGGLLMARGETAAPAEAEARVPPGWDCELGSGISFGEQPIVSGEFSLAWDSKYQSYGLIDNNDPILTPSATLTFFDWFYVSVAAIFDTTKYGHGAGYTSRAWQWTELDPELGLSHSFTKDEFDWLPTTVDFTASWMYEEHPNVMVGPDGDRSHAEDLNSQYVTVELSLPDLWIQPTFLFEQDVDRDSGTYLNLELAHTFALINGDSEEDDPILSLTPSIAQGWGDNRRVRGYLSHAHGEIDENGEEGDPAPLNRNGLMDSWLKLTLDWRICNMCSLSGYVAYVDYIFDSHTREAARRYEARGDHDESYNFLCGLCLTVSF